MRLESYPVSLRLLSALTKKAVAAGLPNSSQAILSHILNQTRPKGFEKKNEDSIFYVIDKQREVC